MLIVKAIAWDLLVLFGLLLIVAKLVAYFALSKNVVLIRKHLDSPFLHMKAGESAKGNIEFAIKAKNAKLYRGALPWAAILFWWPFIPRKRVFQAFNKNVLLFDWDPNPFVWSDLRRGFAETVYLAKEGLQSALNVFEAVAPVRH